MLNTVRNERRESSGLMPLQTIIIARYWTPFIRKLVTAFMDNPYICIGSYMEAAVYAAIKPEFIFLSSDQKAAKVVGGNIRLKDLYQLVSIPISALCSPRL